MGGVSVSEQDKLSIKTLGRGGGREEKSLTSLHNTERIKDSLRFPSIN